MGRWIVILIASFFTVGALAAFFPVLRSAVAFHALGAGIPWIGLIGLGTVYVFHRMSGKG